MSVHEVFSNKIMTFVQTGGVLIVLGYTVMHIRIMPTGR